MASVEDPGAKTQMFYDIECVIDDCEDEMGYKPLSDSDELDESAEEDEAREEEEIDSSEEWEPIMGRPKAKRQQNTPSSTPRRRGRPRKYPSSLVAGRLPKQTPHSYTLVPHRGRPPKDKSKTIFLPEPTLYPPIMPKPNQFLNQMPAIKFSPDSTSVPLPNHIQSIKLLNPNFPASHTSNPTSMTFNINSRQTPLSNTIPSITFASNSSPIQYSPNSTHIINRNITHTTASTPISSTLLGKPAQAGLLFDTEINKLNCSLEKRQPLEEKVDFSADLQQFSTSFNPLAKRPRLSVFSATTQLRRRGRPRKLAPKINSNSEAVAELNPTAEPSASSNLNAEPSTSSSMATENSTSSSLTAEPLTFSSLTDEPAAFSSLIIESSNTPNATVKPAASFNFLIGNPISIINRTTTPRRKRGRPRKHFSKISSALIPSVEPATVLIPTVESATFSNLTSEPTVVFSPTPEASAFSNLTAESATFNDPTVESSNTSIATAEPAASSHLMSIFNLDNSSMTTTTLCQRRTCKPVSEISPATALTPTVEPATALIPTVDPTSTLIPSVKPASALIPTVEPATFSSYISEPAAVLNPTTEASAFSNLIAEPATLYNPPVESSTTSSATAEPAATGHPMSVFNFDNSSKTITPLRQRSRTRKHASKFSPATAQVPTVEPATFCNPASEPAVVLSSTAEPTTLSNSISEPAFVLNSTDEPSTCSSLTAKPATIYNTIVESSTTSSASVEPAASGHPISIIKFDNSSRTTTPLRQRDRQQKNNSDINSKSTELATVLIPTAEPSTTFNPAAEPSTNFKSTVESANLSNLVAGSSNFDKNNNSNKTPTPLHRRGRSRKNFSKVISNEPASTLLCTAEPAAALLNAAEPVPLSNPTAKPATIFNPTTEVAIKSNFIGDLEDSNNKTTTSLPRRGRSRKPISKINSHPTTLVTFNPNAQLSTITDLTPAGPVVVFKVDKDNNQTSNSPPWRDRLHRRTSKINTGFTAKPGSSSRSTFEVGVTSNSNAQPPFTSDLTPTAPVVAHIIDQDSNMTSNSSPRRKRTHTRTSKINSSFTANPGTSSNSTFEVFVPPNSSAHPPINSDLTPSGPVVAHNIDKDSNSNNTSISPPRRNRTHTRTSKINSTSTDKPGTFSNPTVIPATTSNETDNPGTTFNFTLAGDLASGNLDKNNISNSNIIPQRRRSRPCKRTSKVNSSTLIFNSEPAIAEPAISPHPTSEPATNPTPETFSNLMLSSPLVISFGKDRNSNKIIDSKNKDLCEVFVDSPEDQTTLMEKDPKLKHMSKPNSDPTTTIQNSIIKPESHPEQNTVPAPMFKTETSSKRSSQRRGRQRKRPRKNIQTSVTSELICDSTPSKLTPTTSSNSKTTLSLYPQATLTSEVILNTTSSKMESESKHTYFALDLPQEKVEVPDMWHDVTVKDEEPVLPDFCPKRPPGPQLTKPTKTRTPLQLFQLFFTSSVIQKIVRNTNSYAKKQTKAVKKFHWVPLTVNEFYSFLTLVLYMGLVKADSMMDYWTRKRLYRFSYPQSIMSRTRFQSIFWNLYLCDLNDDEKNDKKRGTPHYDRLLKIKPLYTDVLSACRTHFHPNREISVHERSHTSKSRIEVFLNKKPTKPRLFVLADLLSGYNWNFFVYNGNGSTSPEKGIGYNTVMRLLDLELLGTGYKLYTDSFYTSPTLFQDLLKNDVIASGLLHRSFSLPEVKVQDKKADRGSISWCRQGRLLFVRWMDKKEILTCSTMHKAFAGDCISRKIRDADGVLRVHQIPVPPSMKVCNKYSGGKDSSDTLIGYCNILYKTKKWYKTFFLHFLEIAVLNSYALHQHTAKAQNEPPLSEKVFRETLVSELQRVGKGKRPPSSSAYKPTTSTLSTQTEICLPEYFSLDTLSKKRNCVMCKHSGHKVKTHVFCSHCKVPLCFVLSRNCFKKWHTEGHASGRS